MADSLSRLELQAICKANKAKHKDAPQCTAKTAVLKAWVVKHNLHLVEAKGAYAESADKVAVQKPQALKRGQLQAICKENKKNYKDAPKCTASNAVLKAWIAKHNLHPTVSKEVIPAKGKSPPAKEVVPAKGKSVSGPKGGKSHKSECDDACARAIQLDRYKQPQEPNKLANVTYPPKYQWSKRLPLKTFDESKEAYGFGDSKGKKLGEGSFGYVLATKNDNGEEFAIKVSKLAEDNEGITSDILAEVSTLIRLEHPNIVSLIDVIEAENKINSPSLVFRKATSDMTRYITRMTKEQRESEVTLRVMYKTLCGVSYMHSLEIVHRDLKPQNILMFEDEPQIADLGGAKNYACNPSPDWTDTVTTLWYRAPEVLLSNIIGYTASYGKKIDVWSLGCILYELYTGNPLAAGDSELDQLYRLKRSYRDFEREEWPEGHDKMAERHMPKWKTAKTSPLIEKLGNKDLQDVLYACLQWNPDNRATVYEILQMKLWDSVRDRTLEFPSFECSSTIAVRERMPTLDDTDLDSINTRMVYILVEWLFQVHRMFKLKKRIFYLTVSFLLSSLNRLNPIRSSLQGIGLACLHVAALNTEVYSPSLNDYVYISDNAYTADQIKKFTIQVLDVLYYDVVVTTPFDYAHDYAGDDMEEWTKLLILFSLPHPGKTKKLVTLPWSPRKLAKVAEEAQTWSFSSKENERIALDTFRYAKTNTTKVSIIKTLKWTDRVVAIEGTNNEFMFVADEK